MMTASIIYTEHNLLARIRQKLMLLFAKLSGSDRPELSAVGLEKRFNEIADKYDDLIVKLCFAYSRSGMELDDLHQDVLVNIWQGLPRFRGDSSVKTWVYRVTLNTCVSTLRKRKNETDSRNIDDFYNIIDESAEKKAMLVELHECISLLPPVDEAIVLLWLDEFSYDEIAEMVGLNRNTVATRLRRAKEKIKRF